MYDWLLDSVIYSNYQHRDFTIDCIAKCLITTKTANFKEFGTYFKIVLYLFCSFLDCIMYEIVSQKWSLWLEKWVVTRINFCDVCLTMDKSKRNNMVFKKYLKCCVTRQTKQFSTLEKSTKQKHIFNTTLTWKTFYGFTNSSVYQLFLLK